MFIALFSAALVTSVVHKLDFYAIMKCSISREESWKSFCIADSKYNLSPAQIFENNCRQMPAVIVQRSNPHPHINRNRI